MKICVAWQLPQHNVILQHSSSFHPVTALYSAEEFFLGHFAKVSQSMDVHVRQQLHITLRIVLWCVLFSLALMQLADYHAAQSK